MGSSSVAKENARFVKDNFYESPSSFNYSLTLNQSGEGQHSLACEWAGGANSDDWRESLALCLLCALSCHNNSPD
jgi:hypothetical protein